MARPETARRRRLRPGSIAALAFATAGAGGAIAQVATDGSVGPEQELVGPHYAIGAELGTQAGGNLFHSFHHFSIGSGESATFTGPTAIDHVIARVTSGERSAIDGILRSAIPGADLYFINPAGVLFGPDATLDVGGSFHVSSADELRFADGARFSAAEPAASSLTVAAPVAFGFLGRDPAPVVARESGLLVPPGEALSLVGGDVSVSGGFTGILFAPAGRVTLAALASPGALRLADGASSAAHGGRVTLDDFAILQVSGDGGGAVVIRAGELLLTDLSFVLADNLGASDATGGVDVEVVDARIERGAAIVAEALGSGAGPDVAIRAAGTLRLADGGFLSSRSLSSGAPGAVTIDAGTVHLAGSASGLPTGIATDPLDPTSPANAGPVTIRAADSIVIENGSQISTQTAVNRGGPISLEAPNVVIADATVTSSVIGAALAAGTIRIAGDAVMIRDGALVASDAAGLGRGGLIELRAGRGGVTLEDAAVTASTAGAGQGGRIEVVTAGTIAIRGGALLSIATDAGDAGDIALEADRLVLEEAVVASQSLISGGGRIGVEVADRIELTRSELTTSVLGGAGTTAGDITIDPDFLILDASAIIAQANQGQGGKIEITVGTLIQSPDSLISASAGPAGIDGTVDVSTPEIDLSRGLLALEGALLDASALLRERCAARRDVGASSFTATGRGGLPAAPDQPQGSTYRGVPELATAAGRTAAVAPAMPCLGAPG